MQIVFKIHKVKEVYDKVLKDTCKLILVTCKLRKVL